MEKNNQQLAKHLIAAFNQGTISPEEETLMEKYIENGWIELEQLNALHQIDQRLDQVFAENQKIEPNIPVQTLIAQKSRGPIRVIPPDWKDQIQSWFQVNPAYRWALALVLVGLGFLLGRIGDDSREYNSQLSELQIQVMQMREMMMLTLLEKESTSDRLKAVHLTQEMQGASGKVVEALLETIQNDENVNVRLASLEALLNYADDPVVREGLVKSIAFQDSPMMQWALAEAMVALQEKRSVEPLQKLLQQEEAPDEVKEKIQESIDMLM